MWTPLCLLRYVGTLQRGGQNYQFQLIVKELDKNSTLPLINNDSSIKQKYAYEFENPFCDQWHYGKK